MAWKHGQGEEKVTSRLLSGRLPLAALYELDQARFVQAFLVGKRLMEVLGYQKGRNHGRIRAG